MNRQRVEFPLPYNVPHGAEVFNKKGEHVGQVIGTRRGNKTDKPYKTRDGQAVDIWFMIQADVNDDALGGTLQCMEPTIPV